MKQIKFYSTKDEFGSFSNFSRHRIKIGKKIYPTVEHYFQSQKFVGTEYESPIIKASSPALAAKMGRDKKKPLRKDWEEVKEDVMYRGLQSKFYNHLELKELLLSTGDAEIIEDSPIDYYWGCGANGKGKNRLGILLMRLRKELQEEREALEAAEHLSGSMV